MRVVAQKGHCRNRRRVDPSLFSAQLLNFHTSHASRPMLSFIYRIQHSINDYVPFTFWTSADREKFLGSLGTEDAVGVGVYSVGGHPFKGSTARKSLQFSFVPWNDKALAFPAFVRLGAEEEEYHWQDLSLLTANAMAIVNSWVPQLPPGLPRLKVAHVRGGRSQWGR